jgi:hypothetical protein
VWQDAFDPETTGIVSIGKLKLLEKNVTLPAGFDQIIKTSKEIDIYNNYCRIGSW